MGLFDLFKVNSIQDSYAELNFSGDISDATIKNPSLKFTRPKYSSYKSYNKSMNNIEFVDSEYDLSTLANAVQIDGLLNRATSIFTEQINKNGFEIVIPDKRIQEHVDNRLREIELFTNIKNTEIMTTISRQLVTYGNAYVIKSRTAGLSKFGKRYKLYSRQVQPIVGLFVVDATTMKIGLNTSNTQIKYYKQVVNGNEKIYAADDVIHLTYNKIPGLLTGRSSIIPILDDVRALRKLEEEAEILGFQYAVPLYLYKVGTDNHPAAPGEVDSVAMDINNMNTYGIMVTPHTHNVETVTNDNDPIDIIKYVEHFKKRVYSGLGVSAAAMGESDTSNRNTAEAAYLSMQSITKSYQQIIKDKLEIELIKEFILDAGYNPARFKYEVRFHEIDLESTIKKETHVLQKYQGNMITLEEARVELDMPTKLDVVDLYMNNVQIPLLYAAEEAKVGAIDAQADASIRVEKAKPKPTNTTGTKAKGSTSSSKTKKTTKKSEKSTTSKSQPSNQHGKQLSRPTFTKDILTYADSLAVNLLDSDNYKSKLNRETFSNKLLDNAKSTILLIVENNDELNYDELYNRFRIRLNDRVDRLSTIDSDDKCNYIINSILDEIKMLELYTETSNEE